MRPLGFSIIGKAKLGGFLSTSRWEIGAPNAAQVSGTGAVSRGGSGAGRGFVLQKSSGTKAGGREFHLELTLLFLQRSIQVPPFEPRQPRHHSLELLLGADAGAAPGSGRMAEISCWLRDLQPRPQLLGMGFVSAAPGKGNQQDLSVVALSLQDIGVSPLL